MIWVTLLGALCLFLYFFIANPYRIHGDCMEPAIKDGKLYFVNYLYDKFQSYKAGDIIIFRQEGKIWISRIIGLENQEIKISDHMILINNTVYSDAVERNWQNWRYGDYGVDKSVKIPEGHVYVLSDNLSAHYDDSRVFGPISDKMIIGKVWEMPFES